ncbi:aspartate--tRNA ligase [Candidatus Woesearchaeota archaeon]|nr:aspartate--tRNA ligase [Candidatus Woesearchaeota archaeon]
MMRTNTCGELAKKDIGKEAALCGWVQSRRDHGGIIFIDLRDRYGLTQIVLDPQHNKETHKIGEHISREDVLKAKGKVRARGEGLENPKLKTGEIEIIVDQLEILNKAATPPIEIDERKDLNEDMRLKYRYLDLRKPGLQSNLLLRHKVIKLIRDFYDKENFIEIVMVAGFDRYMQIARCLRDEDLRADRQPEFTQLDVEMSFIGEEDIYALHEKLIQKIWKEALNINVPIPIQRMTYQEAMGRYGSDKPDLRFGLELADVTDIVKESSFEVFTKNIRAGGIVKAINVKNSPLSRKDIDALIEFVKIYEAKGLAWMKYDGKALESSVVKFFPEKVQKELVKRLKAEANDLLLFVSDQKHFIVNTALGQLRLRLGKQLGLIDEKKFVFTWVVDFPLIEFDEAEQKHTAVHHPFTSPKDEDLHLLDSHPEKARAKAYDLTVNGTEIGGGSIRIHKSDIQEKIFQLLGISKESAQEKFGFLLEAFRYGAPPHGGIAFGIDRICAILTGNESIREVIAFPKTKNAESLMEGSPSEVDEKQLKELHMQFTFIKGSAKEVLFEKITDVLNRDKIEYKVVEHKPVYTSEEAAGARGTELRQGAKALICKTDRGFVQAVVSAAKELDAESLKRLLQAKSVALANADEVKDIAGVSVGAVPPFGNLFGIPVYIDASVTANEQIAFNAGLHTKSIIMKSRDLVKVTGAKIGEFGK